MLLISSKPPKGSWASCFMISLNNLPKKVKLFMQVRLPVINKLYTREPFIGGRIGYSPEFVFKWLLVKKITNWDYRTVGEAAHLSASTLVRWNQRFENKDTYQKFFIYLVKMALRKGLITGEKVAMDSSFVPTFSKHEEEGSGGWNGYKEKFGFKLHCLIDVKTKFPIALIATNGVVNDNPVAMPLLRKAKPFIKKCSYVLADKGYDDSNIVNFIVKSFKAKAGISMRKKSKLAKGKRNRYGNLFNWRFFAKGRTFKKSILNQRTEIERFFSKVKRKFNLGKELTRGIGAFTRNAYLALISYQLERFQLVGITSF